MPETQTNSPGEAQPSGEDAHRGKHRGPSSATEEQEQTAPAQGRHRRPPREE